MEVYTQEMIEKEISFGVEKANMNKWILWRGYKFYVSDSDFVRIEWLRNSRGTLVIGCYLFNDNEDVVFWRVFEDDERDIRDLAWEIFNRIN